MPSFNVSILCINFYKILCNGSRDMIIIRTLEKTEQQLPLKSNTHLNCIIVTYYNAYLLHRNFCTVSFIRNQGMGNLKIFGKIVTTVPSIKLCLQNLHQCQLLKYVYCMQNFVQFQAIESEIELSRKFWEKRNSSAPTELYLPKLHQSFFQ